MVENNNVLFIRFFFVYQHESNACAEVFHCNGVIVFPCRQCIKTDISITIQHEYFVLPMQRLVIWQLLSTICVGYAAIE